MAAGGHFGCTKSRSISFLAISDRYTTYICFEIFGKMAAVGHFGCPKFTLDHISGHFRSIQIFFFFFFFYKMAAGGRFGCPKITFDLISIHFTSIPNFLTKWLPAAILDVRITLSIAFLAISDRYATFFVVWNFWQNGRRRPFWMGRQCQLSISSEIFGWVMHVSSLKNVA